MVNTFYHCLKTVRIRSYFGQYSVSMPENTNQINSEYGQFLPSVSLIIFVKEAILQTFDNNRVLNPTQQKLAHTGRR